MQSTESQPQPVVYDPFAGDALERVVPTTEPQREVWLADKLGRDASLAFNESVTLRFHGALDTARLEAALQALVDRHDALRANLGPDGETFCIYQTQTIALERHDFSQLAASDRAAALSERMRLAVDTPFELESGRLFRAELLRLAPAEHVLLLTAHHIVCDGWSWWVLVRELAALHAAADGIGVDALPPAEQFADYALQEATHPGGAQFAADERYWLARFADGAPVLDLPTDRPRPARRGFASARRDFAIDGESLAAIRRMGAGCGASLFATLLAGFASTLGRLASQDRLVVGIPAAGQSLDGHDGLVGHCVNTLPLLFELTPAQTADELVRQSQSTLLDAIEHQRYTYGTLLRKVALQRDPARLPLVSVLFNIDQALDQASAAFPGLRMEFDSNPRTHENFEIFVNAVQTHDGLRLECQYNRDLFDADTIDRWLSAYRNVLHGMAANPQVAAAEIPMADEAAMRELLALQPAPTPYERNAPVHLLFERQCDLTPDRVAVRDGHAHATYAQLDARANRIANLLRSNGVHHGKLVGIALDRSIDMLAALLGVLKAEAGYVPLDPGFPAERLAYMAGDAGLAALLTTSGHAGRFDLRGRPILALDAIAREIASMPATRPERAEIGPESVAYVIYTSGSTGRPKGVQVPHRAVVNFLGSMRQEPGLAANDVLVAVTTLSFDIAVLELLLPLTVGAQVVIAVRDTAVDGSTLAALLHECGATAMQATPATWRMLMETDWRGDTDFKALCGGEPLPPELAADLLPRCGTLWNLYGPTETTVWSTCMRVSPASAMPDIHIGRPIANTSVWIVDPAGELCPLGVPGEICIGGEGVTLGYLQRPELTGERFVPDRFTAVAEGGATRPLYRTGDRGRWRADGNLQHLGRLDFQVKVRGYRIELGEIESLLAAHPDVAQALAVAREDRADDVRLVAYIVPRPGTRFDEQALLTHLRGTLPDYMVPQHLMPLAAMPLLPNGKIDRKALPAPTLSARVGNAQESPRTPLEQRIAEAMAQVLGLPQVGIHDDFFALGGHSLLAAKLTTRLSKELDRAISLRTLFDAPTVARLAEHAGGAEGGNPVPRQHIARRGDQSRAPLSRVQERLRMMEEFNPGTLSYNTPSGHRLRGPLDVAKLDEALRQLAQRQTVLRTAIAVEEGEPVQVVLDDISPRLKDVVDLSHLAPPARERELARCMREMIDTPFTDLADAPLFRARLFRLAEEEHALFFMPHHIVWDGWSFDLMYQDLSELYTALVENRAPVLPDLPVTYGDYATWHNAWLEGPEYATQVAFWRERLGRPNAQGGRPEALPTDKPRQRGMSGASRSFQVMVPETLTSSVRIVARELDVTVFVVLLSAYYAVLAHASGQRDLVVGTPVRGRNVSEVEGLMGYFTNLLPLRVEVEMAAGFDALARDVRAVVLDSFAAPEIRLEDLTRELSLRSEGGGSMLYQALFSFQDVRHRGTRWGNVGHERIEVFQPGATEDLGLWFVEGHDHLGGGLIYNADILHDDTIRRLRARYVNLLRALSDNPRASLATLLEQSEGEDTIDHGDPPQPATAVSDDETSMNTDAIASNGVDSGALRDRYLIDLWTRLLDTEVQSGDNFFDIGGNSLLAVQMADRVARETGVRLKLMEIATLSLAQLAAGLPAPAEQPQQRKGFGALLKFLRPRAAGKDR